MARKPFCVQLLLAHAISGPLHRTNPMLFHDTVCSPPTGGTQVGLTLSSIPVASITLTLVRLSALPLSDVHLKRNFVGTLLGMVSDTEPDASVEVPPQPLTFGLLIRKQLKLLPNPDVVQLSVITPLAITELALALNVTDGPTPAVLTLTNPFAGSTATALSVALDVSGVC